MTTQWTTTSLGLLLLASVLGGCATTTSAPPGPLAPLIGGWEQFFKLEWDTAERNGVPIVRGYVLNDWGMPAARLRVLVDSLTPEGGVLGQRISWVGMITPGTRAYFEVPVQPAPVYRVSVFSWDWIDEPRRWPGLF